VGNDSVKCKPKRKIKNPGGVKEKDKATRLINLLVRKNATSEGQGLGDK
jgi:hypothetical protein